MNEQMRNTDQGTAKIPYQELDKLTYVKNAEDIIKTLDKNNYGEIRLTTNQIRIILDIINEVYVQIKLQKEEELSEDIQSKIQYSKIKIAYQAGRKSEVRDFVEKTSILKHLDNVGRSKSKMILLAHYMEALVAYHKYYSEN